LPATKREAVVGPLLIVDSETFVARDIESMILYVLVVGGRSAEVSSIDDFETLMLAEISALFRYTRYLYSHTTVAKQQKRSNLPREESYDRQ